MHIYCSNRISDGVVGDLGGMSVAVTYCIMLLCSNGSLAVVCGVGKDADGSGAVIGVRHGVVED